MRTVVFGLALVAVASFACGGRSKSRAVVPGSAADPAQPCVTHTTSATVSPDASAPGAALTSHGGPAPPRTFERCRTCTDVGRAYAIPTVDAAPAPAPSYPAVSPPPAPAPFVGTSF